MLLFNHWMKYGVCVNMESAKFRFHQGEWAAGSVTVVEAGPACRCPLGVSVGEQMCWPTVATTGCVHWRGISTVSAGVGQGWEVSGDAAQTGPFYSVHENAFTRVHFWVVNVHTGAHKHTPENKQEKKKPYRCRRGDITHVKQLLNLWTPFLLT